MLDKKKAKPLYRQTKDFTLQDFIKIVLTRKWLILASLAIAIGISFFYIKTTPPVYQAASLIVRDVAYEQLPGNLLGIGYYGTAPSSNMGVILKSQQSLGEIRTKIMDKYHFDIPIVKLSSGLGLSENEETNVITISAQADVPEHTQAIANVAADILIKRTFEIRSSEISQGAEFLKEQMKQVEEKMQDTEGELNRFRDKEGLIPESPDRISGGLIGKLGEIQSELLQNEGDIELKKTQLKTLENLIDEKKKYVQSISTKNASPQIDQIQERLINMQLELSTKLETLTEKDPSVIALKKRIETTQNQLKSEFDKLLEDPNSTTLDPVSELRNLTEQYIKSNVDLKGLDTKGQLLTERLNKFRSEHPELASKQVELIRLERQSRIYEQTYTAMAAKYQDVRLMEQMKGAGLRVVDYAGMPRAPISPKKKMIVTGAIVLGLSFGLIIAFFLEYIDDTIKTKDDVERFLELPVLGIISQVGPFKVSPNAIKKRENPSLSFSKNGELAKQKDENIRHKPNKEILSLLSHSLIYSSNGTTKMPSVENYWNLAMSIKYVNMDNPIKTMLVTSVIPGERKTTTASNLAIVKARSGMKVLLIDSDLRRPMLHRIFQQNRKPGLTDLLIFDESTNDETFDSLFNDCIRPTVIENLYLLTCGSSISNSDALLSSDKMKDLLENLKDKFDLIIIDSAPLLVVAGVVALSKESDGVLLVMYAGKTRRDLAIHGKEILDSVNAKILGVALTGVDLTRQYGYYYRRYYNYYYHSKDDNS